MTLPKSARDLTDDERELVELARDAIDVNTDAGSDEEGVRTMGAAVRAGDGRAPSSASISITSPVGHALD